MVFLPGPLPVPDLVCAKEYCGPASHDLSPILALVGGLCNLVWPVHTPILDLVWQASLAYPTPRQAHP